MVGLVLVSHSKKLAESVRELVLQMTGPDFPVVVASGVGEGHNELGTDAVHIAEVLQASSRPDGLLVLMDLGSAVLSSETALELLDHSKEQKIFLCSAPLVEGAVAAAVQASAGGSLEEVAREASNGLAPKQQQLKMEDDAAQGEIPAPAASGETAEIILTVANEHGLHARPAAAFVRTVSKFSSSIQIVNLTAGRGPVPARSLTSVALLQVRQGDRIKVLICGADRNAALQAIRELAEEGFGETVRAGALVAARSSRPATPGIEGAHVGGKAASEGIAVGPLRMLESSLMPVEEGPAGVPALEFEKLNRAMKRVAEEISQGARSQGIGVESSEILDAQALILNDPILQERLKARLADGHSSAARSWMEVTEELAAQYQSMQDDYLRERAADVRDIGRRVVHALRGSTDPSSIHMDPPGILFARELLPSEAAACDPATVLGVITREGSATSHSAILLRTLGIPMVVGATAIDEAATGKLVAMDGATGEIWLEPGKELEAAFAERKRLLLERQKQSVAAEIQPSITLDGERMEILANVGSAEDARTAFDSGAEGIGLLRTEFLFLHRNEAPSEEEQVAALSNIFAAVSGPIIVRTLDAGADKPLSFFPQREERNPFLGIRGIRLSLQFPDIYLTHLRAILTAGAKRDLWLMLPMIAVEDEVHQALSLLEQAHRELASHGCPHAWPIQRGAMIEVPSAAILTERLAELLDFFSIGTNDLTQYVMAAERANPELANMQDALQPAVLRLIKTALDGAKTRKRHISVCGDSASDPAAAAIFAGMGIRSLSVRPKQVAPIKALFRELRMRDLVQIGEKALRCHDMRQVRDCADRFLSTRYSSATCSADSQHSSGGMPSQILS